MTEAMKQQLQGLNVPKHIAVIMDGNGRWAKKRGRERTYGHKKGSETLKTICRSASDMGVKYITAYAFSTENWSRPQDEVDYIMNLLRTYLKDSLKNAKKDNMRVCVIGSRERLSADIVKHIEVLETQSSTYTGLQLNIAINYGGRDEIVRATRHLAEDVLAGRINPELISDTLINSYLDTANCPDPELLIRTSGEARISNFLLWQLAYSEFYFSELLWPDFNEEELMRAISYYNKRERRFGGLME